MDQTMPGSVYRRDIDGLRAIAVLPVIFYHFGFLPNGYLGVDVFFVISGYLITGILYQEVIQDRFSLTRFYLRRIRRIIPLVLFVSLVALTVGLLVMLPDDLENLSQSVVATNLFANNILLWITTGNYWALVNEYKPLMHTWSLGIEEQFYLIYPLLFLFLTGKRKRLILPVLLLLTAISLAIFFLSDNSAAKFYLIQYRFFELAFGGLGAMLIKDRIRNSLLRIVCLLVLSIVLLVDTGLPGSFKLFIIVVSSLGILVSAGTGRASRFFLENNLMTAIGKISFSLYMWHQVVLAYTRYVVKHDYTAFDAVVIFIIIVLLSILSYLFIEQPFRNKTKISTRSLLLTAGVVFLFSTAFAFYLYSVNGVIRDVPELDKYRKQAGSKLLRSGETNINYNSRIYELNKSFSRNHKTKVLVIGDSFARDWANVLLESAFAGKLDISYVTLMDETLDMNERLAEAKYIFFSEFSRKEMAAVSKKYTIDTSKVWNVGTKNFGIHNGVFYQKRNTAGYCRQRTYMDKNFLEKNNRLKQEWGNKYIDLIGMIADKNGMVPVFTPECKFISQDAHHLTTNGSVYFAQLLARNKIFRIE